MSAGPNDTFLDTPSERRLWLRSDLNGFRQTGSEPQLQLGRPKTEKLLGFATSVQPPGSKTAFFRRWIRLSPPTAIMVLNVPPDLLLRSLNFVSQMRHHFLLLTLAVSFCAALPTADLVVPERKVVDFVAYSTSASFIQAMHVKVRRH